MPYIPRIRRDAIESGGAPQSAGELNYLVTKLCSAFYARSEKRYQDCNDILGALDGAKLEFYRRVVVPYEDKKRAENGDVY